MMCLACAEKAKRIRPSSNTAELHLMASCASGATPFSNAYNSLSRGCAWAGAEAMYAAMVVGLCVPFVVAMTCGSLG